MILFNIFPAFSFRTIWRRKYDVDKNLCENCIFLLLGKVKREKAINDEFVNYAYKGKICGS